MRSFKVVIFIILILGVSLPSLSWGDDVIAQVNGKALTKEQFVILAKDVVNGQPAGFSLTDEQKEQMVDGWVKAEVLAEEAMSQGLDKKPEARYQMDEAYREVLVKLLLEKEISGKVKVSKSDIQDYYDAHKDRLKTTERRKARHILLKTEEKADKVYQELKDGGDFSKLAEKYSEDDGNKDKGGDLGYFAQGDMVPEFEKVVFAMKKGDVSKPFKTQFGWHVVKLDDIRPEGTKKLDEVQGEISRELLRQKQLEALDAYVDKLKSKANIETHKDLLKGVKIKNEKEE